MSRSGKSGEHHVWRFFRAGGFDQVRLDRGRDVAALGTLDQKLWVALACPTRGVEFDERTLDLIDSDRDGRIRAPDLLAAAEWTCALLTEPDDLALGRDVLPLAAIDVQSDEGREILASAQAILRLLGKAEASEISIRDTADVERIYDATAFDGDGVIPIEAAEDDDTKAVLASIVDCVGPDIGRGGKPGVSKATADRFFAEAALYAAWRGEAEARRDAILPLGDATENAAAALCAVAAKLDDFFMRCRLAAFDPAAESALNPPLAVYQAFAAEMVSPSRPDIASLPLARIAAGQPLALDRGINPAWEQPIERFRRYAVGPLLGEQENLGESQWMAIKEKLAAHQDWAARKPAGAVGQLGIDRINAVIGSDVRRRIEGLIAQDQALAPAMNAISRVEKLVRLQRDLLPLLNNIVAFRDFYTRAGKAIFQAGTLYLDGRSCDLCVRVDDEAKHAQLATLSRIYLAYCLCTRDGGKERMMIAAAFTAGGSDNLMVGRNGVFYDRRGRDWDATIVKLIEHPISLRQAFWLPYQQLGRFIGEQFQKLAAARAVGTQLQMTAGVGAIGAAPLESKAKEQAFDAARLAGIFAAIGLALAAIGTAVASLVTGFMSLLWWQMPLALLAIVTLISGPFVVIAILKLSKRNLGPILDACGWAVNTRMRINIPFGVALTSLAQLPKGAERSLSDPYAEKPRPWGWYLGLAVVVALAAAWNFGWFANGLGALTH